MTHYGLPYQGSKSKIAMWVLRNLPAADTLVDLFAGGGAIAHAALLTGRYKHVIANDITDSVRLFADAIAGKYSDETRWISREDFFAHKDSDPYVRLIWSFGNKQREYIYGRAIEPMKRALHSAVVLRDYRPMRDEYGIDLAQIDALPTAYERYTATRKLVKSARNQRIDLERLQHLERLERLQHLECLQHLKVSVSDYRDVSIPEGAVIYCDIPYRATSGYTVSFDHVAFYEWAQMQTQPVYISEYDMPPPFVCIAAKERISTASPDNRARYVERIFTLPKWAKTQNKLF